jgi:hypothetical protein
MIKTLGLRSLGILFVLAGAALLVPSLGASEKRSKTREPGAALHAQLAACPHSGIRAPADATGAVGADRSKVCARAQ